MGRSGSDLKPFLHDALEGAKYKNLVYVDILLMTFQLTFPRKKKNLSISDQKLLMDWDMLKGRTYRGLEDYSRAMRAFKRGLKKSDYIICVDESKLIYRFASIEELEELRKKRKTGTKLKKVEDANICSPLSIDSGYDSAKSPETPIEYKFLSHKNSVLSSVVHDHYFGGLSDIVEETFEDDVTSEDFCDDTEIKAADDLPMDLESVQFESLCPLDDAYFNALCNDLSSDLENITSLKSIADPVNHVHLTEKACEVWQFVEKLEITENLLMFVFKCLDNVAVHGIQHCEGGIYFQMSGEEMKIFQGSTIVKLHRLKDSNNYIMNLERGRQLDSF
ncbi:uncharacterized protein LOC118204848 [Stegodyphus dumicola]|uniref:uncharacterized protein LOC118204848 n=1 Tax=Stegodyphus dumicola TaxID=202533 RepID=UPI0015AFC0B8|nr:uncharacterized protein LOC118204848 [Stegodyphus dumicola]